MYELSLVKIPSQKKSLFGLFFVHITEHWWYVFLQCELFFWRHRHLLHSFWLLYTNLWKTRELKIPFRIWRIGKVIFSQAYPPPPQPGLGCPSIQNRTVVWRGWYAFHVLTGGLSCQILSHYDGSGRSRCELCVITAVCTSKIRHKEIQICMISESFQFVTFEGKYNFWGTKQKEI